jgi:hypothetical protein
MLFLQFTPVYNRGRPLYFLSKYSVLQLTPVYNRGQPVYFTSKYGVKKITLQGPKMLFIDCAYLSAMIAHYYFGAMTVIITTLCITTPRKIVTHCDTQQNIMQGVAVFTGMMNAIMQCRYTEPRYAKCH